jgi:hypothetical protein
LVFQSLEVRKSSARETPLARIASLTSFSFPYFSAMSMCRCLSASASPRPMPSVGDQVPRPSAGMRRPFPASPSLSVGVASPSHATEHAALRGAFPSSMRKPRFSQSKMKMVAVVVPSGSSFLLVVPRSARSEHDANP